MAGTLVFSFDFIWFHFFFFSPLPHLSVGVVWWCLEDRRYVMRIVLVGWEGFSSPFPFPPSSSLSRVCVCVCYTVSCVTVLCHKKKKRKIHQLNLRDFFFLFFLFSLSLLEKTKRKNCSSLSFFLFLFPINFLCDILFSFHYDFINYHLTQNPWLILNS